MRAGLVRRLSLLAIGVTMATLGLVACESGGGLQSLAIDPAEVTMQSRGENIQLKAIGKRADGSVVPEDAMDLRWSYSDGSIASVDKSGLLRGVLAGEGTVTVKSEKYDKSATIKVHVLPPKFTPEQMQANVQKLIDAVGKLDVSAASDQEFAKSMMKDVMRSLTEAKKYIGQGTNNTLASVELLNAAQYMEVLAPKTSGALAAGLAEQAKAARQFRDELFAY
ncbi:MAG TPA: Ig-like domain-containing protein [Chloroflexota bacterium]